MMKKMWDLLKYGERTALISENGDAVTYKEINYFSEQFYGSIKDRCLAFILCSNTIGSVLSYISCVNNRIVPMLLNSEIDIEQLTSLYKLYLPKIIVIPECKQKEYTFLYFFKKYKEVYKIKNYIVLMNEYNMNRKIYEELALLLATSGSTGSPKFVRQSYKNVFSNTNSIIKYLKLDESERAITTLPMNYTYGLSILNTHLAAGATVLLTEKTLMQKEFWQFFKEQKATSFGGVPYTYEILNKLQIWDMDLPSLKTMTQAGGKLTVDLHEKFAQFAHDRGKNFIVMYGQCEATARMGYLPANKALEKKGSMGIAIPGGNFKLIDAIGNEITTEYTIGELVYEGANVTLGYAEQLSDLSKGNDRHGILETGDMAQFDEDGYFYIVGRKKRFLKIYGNRVNLDEMERIIRSKFNSDVVCAGVDDQMYIFLTDSMMSQNVRAYVSKKTRLNPRAFKMVVIGEIPRNDSGKIKYKELEKYYDF